MLGPLRTKGQTSKDAPLASQLKWFARLVVGFVFALAACATALTTHLSDQLIRLNAAQALDDAHRTIAPSLAETEFLLTENSIQPALTQFASLRGHLDHYASLVPSDPLLDEAEASLSEMEALTTLSARHGMDAHRHLTEVNAALAFFTDESGTRAERVNSRRTAIIEIANAGEDSLRALNTDLLLLSTTIFAATQILKEIEAITRFNSGETGRRAPIQRVDLTVKHIPSACAPNAEVSGAETCGVSNARINTALERLHNSTPDTLQARLDAVRRAASAYIRVSERQFGALSYQIETTLDASTFARESLDDTLEVSAILEKMAYALSQTKSQLQRAEQGNAADWDELNQLVTRNAEQIYNLTLKTAEIYNTMNVSPNVIQTAYQNTQSAWASALNELKATAELREKLLVASDRMNASLERIISDERTKAQESVTVVSSVAIGALMLLAAMAAAFVWGGRNFVVRPLEVTTETILHLSDGRDNGPVKFVGSSLGLNRLEKALEKLRLANIEREELTQQTLEQRSEIEASHQRLNTIANVAPVGLYELRQMPNGTSSFRYCSDRFLSMNGLSQEEAEQATLLDQVIEEERPAFARTLEESAKFLKPFTTRLRVRDGAGRDRWMSVISEATRSGNDDVVWTGAMVDVTGDVEREEALREAQKQAEMTHAISEIQALHDGLTGLPNRRYYDQVFAERHAAAYSDRQPAVLIRIDLDFFKQVNDTLGHEAGDLVLLRVSDVLRELTHAEDFAARIGGDEFSIMMEPGATYDDAAKLTERIQESLSKTIYYQDKPCRFGASFGIARVDDFSETGSDLNLFADAALYQAKELGRNRIEFFTPDLHRVVQRSRALSSEIQDALEERQFEPFFQPQFDAKTGLLAGAEILMRWQHPVEGTLTPAAFMSVAEQLRLVPEIDRQIMEKSLDALKRFGARGIQVPKISLNASSERLHDPDIIDLANKIVSHGTRVAFELLESILVEDESHVFRMHLDRLRDAGIEVEIDDFGSGHASAWRSANT